jgi:hypothetical protein
MFEKDSYRVGNPGKNSRCLEDKIPPDIWHHKPIGRLLM